MTPLFASRAAEEFDRVLDGTAPRHVADRYVDLTDTVEVLRTAPAVAPRPEFVADLRARLMAAAETELVPAPAVVRPLPARGPRRRLASVAAALVIVGGSAGMAAAASGALPGETLYPVKRGIEDISAAARIGEASKGTALLDQAQTRLGEARELQAADADPALVASTVDAFRQDASSGAGHLFAAYGSAHRAADITRVRDFTATHMTDLRQMADTRDESVQGTLLDAADTLADIDQEARDLCGGCGPATALDLPTAFSAGAGAASVDSLLARPVAQARRDIAQTQRAMAAADAQQLAQLAQLQKAAEKTAGTLTPLGTPTPSGTPAAPTTTPVTSTLTPSGGLVPSLTRGSAVTGLVRGVTGTLSTTTTKITEGTPLQQPVGDAVAGLTDTVKGVTDGVTEGVTGGLTGGLPGGLGGSGTTP